MKLLMTFASGLMALTYWTIRDFGISWRLPNLYLLLYPVYYIVILSKQKT
jgi:hypothetical protein